MRGDPTKLGRRPLVPEPSAIEQDTDWMSQRNLLGRSLPGEGMPHARQDPQRQMGLVSHHPADSTRFLPTRRLLKKVIRT